MPAEIILGVVCSRTVKDVEPVKKFIKKIYKQKGDQVGLLVIGRSKGDLAVVDTGLECGMGVRIISAEWVTEENDRNAIVHHQNMLLVQSKDIVVFWDGKKSDLDTINFLRKAKNNGKLWLVNTNGEWVYKR